jgi:hypothetical protein
MTMTKKSFFALALCSLLFAACTIDNTVNDKPISKPEKEQPTGPSTVSLFGYFKNSGYTWNGADVVTVNSDGTVTYDGQQWGGYAMWLGDGELSDLSAFSKLVIEFASATSVPSQLVLNGEPAINEWGQVGSKWADPGTTKIEMDFSSMNVSNLSQVALQLAEAGTVVIKAIYLVGK